VNCFGGQDKEKLEIILVGHGSGYVNVDGWQETTLIQANQRKI